MLLNVKKLANNNKDNNNHHFIQQLLRSNVIPNMAFYFKFFSFKIKSVAIANKNK
jgi:hypothetical protein